jgi:hypothetical protein
MSRRRSGWPKTGRYSPRKGAKRLPEKQRQRILRRYPTCQLAIPGVCTGRSVEECITASTPPTADPTPTTTSPAHAASATATCPPAARQNGPQQHAADGTYANQNPALAFCRDRSPGLHRRSM